MAKITLDVKDKYLPEILTILENLKSELITSINVEKKEKIKPVSSSITNNTKKYLTKENFKNKLSNKKIEEDEFLPQYTQKNKYLSTNEYKKRLKG